MDNQDGACQWHTEIKKNIKFLREIICFLKYNLKIKPNTFIMEKWEI